MWTGPDLLLQLPLDFANNLYSPIKFTRVIIGVKINFLHLTIIIPPWYSYIHNYSKSIERPLSPMSRSISPRSTIAPIKWLFNYFIPHLVIFPPTPEAVTKEFRNLRCVAKVNVMDIDVDGFNRRKMIKINFTTIFSQNPMDVRTREKISRISHPRSMRNPKHQWRPVFRPYLQLGLLLFNGKDSISSLS